MENTKLEEKKIKGLSLALSDDEYIFNNYYVEKHFIFMH